jgi:hypothetical protein
VDWFTWAGPFPFIHSLHSSTLCRSVSPVSEAVFMPLPEESSFSSCTSNTDTYFHKLRHGFLQLPILPLRNGTVRRIAMASSLLNFLVWDGSANIAARHSSIRPIGSKVKSPAWSCLTSSFANIAMWKRVTSDCILRKSLFGIALASETRAAREKNRLCGDRKATGIEAPNRQKDM